MPDEHDKSTEAAQASRSTVASGATRLRALPGGSAHRAKAPLITAVEIKNFKGIGRPIRVVLRPITLLFGRNSAGKSTILHALCYAHEILSHRNVDVHKTDLGGDRVDLGGFRNLVHTHDTTRTVRVRFELNLEGWHIPEGLDEKIVSPFHVLGGDAESWLFPEPSARPRSGWLELRAGLRDHQPVLAAYELGVNDACVGRLHPRHPTGVSLEFNPTHPILEPSLSRKRAVPLDNSERAAESSQTKTRTDLAREATETDGNGWQQRHVEVLGLFSPLPIWNELLLLDDHGRSDADGHDLTEFMAMVSALFVGIGQAVRDELTNARYIGPVRALHPQTSIASSARHRTLEAFAADFANGHATSGSQAPHPTWADGSRAWPHLHTHPRPEMIEEVSDWLAREDRLDAGYALRVRSAVMIYEDEAQLIPELRKYHELRKTFGNAHGSVNLAGWARAEAEAIVDKIYPHYRQAALDRCDRLRTMFAKAPDGPSILDLVDELDRDALQHAREAFGIREQSHIEPAIRRETERSLRLIEDLWRLLTLSIQDIELQIPGSGEDVVNFSESLTPAYCRRLNDLLPRWERDALKWIYLTGTIDGYRTMTDMPQEVRKWMRRVEDARGRNDVSIEIEQLLGEFRTAVQASVALASRSYRRQGTLVAMMEGGNCPPEELGQLAAAIAARPPHREIELITTKDLGVRVADVGVGISQVLPVVVAALDPERPGITAIEQPELHLHPKLQVELGDLFAQPVDDGRVFLLENHSEHLMLRLLRRIEETHSGELPKGKPPLRPEQVSVVFIEQVDGEVRATPLRIDETGEFIDRWPQGFFDERDDELF